MLVKEIAERDQFRHVKWRCRIGVHLFSPRTQLLEGVDYTLAIEARRFCAGNGVAGWSVSPNIFLSRNGFGIAEHLQHRRHLRDVARFTLQDAGEPFGVPGRLRAYLFKEAENGWRRDVSDRLRILSHLTIA